MYSPVPLGVHVSFGSLSILFLQTGAALLFVASVCLIAWIASALAPSHTGDSRFTCMLSQLDIQVVEGLGPQGASKNHGAPI